MKKIVVIFMMLLSGLIGLAQEKEQYPIPVTEDLLFYIQRNHNANTIIYDANFDEYGDLDHSKPMDVYWIRYDEEGQRKELGRFEKWAVFGVDCEKANNGYDFRMKLSAKKAVKFWLKQTAPYEASIITDIGGELSKLDHLYITLDKQSPYFKVLYGEFFGESIDNGDKTYFKKNVR